MKLATGVDIEENNRFESKIDDKKFLSRIFTQDEIDYCLSKKNPHQHFAVRFCAKEAAIKALCSFYEKKISLRLSQIEIIKKADVPFIKIHDKEFENLEFSLSLSHCKCHSMAQVLCFTKEKL